LLVRAMPWIPILLAVAITSPTGARHGWTAKASAAEPQAGSRRRSVTDAEIRKAMIAESIANYPGNCPCPYNKASNGSSCGRRSAWNRAGGESPLCYPSDISAAMVAGYRSSHNW